MFEIAKAIHEAIHTESTLAFVLLVSLVGGALSGSTAWLVDRGYKNALEESQVKRRLTEWQRTKFKATLSRFAGTKIVILASEGVDTAHYANEFCSLLKDDMHWSVKGPLKAPDSAPAVDIQLSISGRYFVGNPPIPIPDAFTGLEGMFQFLNIRSRSGLVFDDEVPTDVIVMWVGGEGTIPSNSYPPIGIKGITIPSDF